VLNVKGKRRSRIVGPTRIPFRRRRMCKKCEHRFFTFEVAEEPPKIIELKVETPKKRRAPKKQEPDFDKMTDEEIEEYFYK
jgi:transcriptional regulator NrdR family protein